jgi:glucose/mannose-6-phosphate isomerase
MSSILDNQVEITQLDKSNVLGSAQALADQVADAWDQSQTLTVAIDATKVRNIVVSGMGGSALGPDVIQRAIKDQLTVPIEVSRDYTLPGYVNENTLVVLSSWSGTTEETLAAAQDALNRKAQIVGITTGGGLADFLTQHNCTMFKISATHNPSNQPRMGIGYSVFGIIALLAKVGLIRLSDAEVNAVIAAIRRTKAELDVTVPQDKNPAKQMAFHFQGRIPVLVAAEHLEGAIHVFQNQLNENAKCYAEYRVIPELNHHLMEGLRFPLDNDKTMFFLLCNSTLYGERTQKRLTVTQQVIEKAGIDSEAMQLVSASRWEQVFELITFGTFVNFYLAMLEGIDPAPIETVDFFKAQMKA